jgi:hypothetical protein
MGNPLADYHYSLYLLSLLAKYERQPVQDGIKEW